MTKWERRGDSGKGQEKIEIKDKKKRPESAQTPARFKNQKQTSTGVSQDRR